MGRLFWKFFLIVWLAQLAAVIATGAIFWAERRSLEARFAERLAPPAPPPGEFGPPGAPPLFAQPDGAPPPFPDPRKPPVPWLHVISGLLASLASAAGIAWYVARPVRRLKQAFAAASEGDLSLRVAPGMGRRRDELADLGRDFDRMSEQLHNLLDAQTRLLHDVSHELRSPLARLHAAIGLARQEPARFEETMARLEREGERMNQLVGELLTLSRLEAGVQGKVEVLDIDELMAELIEDARLEAAARKQIVDVEECRGLRVRANPELLHRAVENVVRNALKHAPDGSTIRIVSSRLANQRCRISVFDPGPGVPEDELPFIFEPFRRTRNAVGNGHGLGLAIARRVMRSIDGTITANNLAGGGFRVTLEIPLADLAESR